MRPMIHYKSNLASTRPSAKKLRQENHMPAVPSFPYKNAALHRPSLLFLHIYPTSSTATMAAPFPAPTQETTLELIINHQTVSAPTTANPPSFPVRLDQPTNYPTFHTTHTQIPTNPKSPNKSHVSTRAHTGNHTLGFSHVAGVNFSARFNNYVLYVVDDWH
ncbi:hypothetical protein G7K_2205-t1 [Saitoella complicata NRRL Y-17804]|uniref:Uncharacterized protein n=1 Tax=Saitoella complicata (strain BCRC 22490 / CBS 7301 / JCM 7358 / NBRC 10748 / NRRL Y-17804) TaxID=698492 RepID=A0A0E9NDT6_SAICN|nr:hypothetical protein G7K_2205-t1 [Saitoella complicata NRRL Y-17804]